MPFMSLNKKFLAIIASIVVLVIVAVTNMEFATSRPDLPATVDFNFHVKPILVQKCYFCHGPDPSSRKGGLRLDTEEGATQLLKSGNQAVNRDHPDISSLLNRIEHKDPDMVMPPPDSKMLLTEREIAILAKWIETGAQWKPHWAFIAPNKTVMDRVKTKTGNPIDFFIKEQLEANGLSAAPEANKNSLIRRVAYLLTGLPPTTEAIEAFTQDKSPDAYEKMLDRYLNAPAFGERWARHWMDLTRYAETRGHEFDFAIDGTWRYRDYLVRAFNDDIGYDQLLTEQLAGDLLANPRVNAATGANESHLGTVFLAMTEGVQGPVDIRKDEADRIDNMIDVTSKTFQSLTLSCSRCHDHKFDPIPTTDYYAMYGIMESTRFSPVPANRGAADLQRVDQEQKNRKQQRASVAGSWLAHHPAITGSSFQQVQYKLPPDADTSYTILGDFRGNNLNNWKADGLAFAPVLGNPVFDSLGKNLLYLQEGKASSVAVGYGVYGVLRSPSFKIADNAILVRALGEGSTIRVVINNFQLISDPIYGGLSRGVNSPQWEDIVFDVSTWKGHNAYIEIMPGYYNTHVYQLPESAFVEVKYAVAYSGKTPHLEAASSGADLTFAKAIERWQNYQSTEHDIRLLNKALQKGLLSRQGLGANLSEPGNSTRKLDTAFYSGVYDGFAINSPVFIRGDHQQVSPDDVPRRFFTALNSNQAVYQSKGSGRLELAASMLHPDNPLTARVMVNRLWHHLFGRGIVETVDNFGLQGKLPTHPALLDYLALRFQQEDWSVKSMIKLILLSQTFRAATDAPKDALKKDPTNLYLARFPLLRLEAEAIRDGMLMAGGNLDTTMYGPPVPVYLTSFMNGRGKPGKSGPLDGAGRRSIYQEVRRNFLDPNMLAFDRPIPFSTFGHRNVTNVPAQSLYFMNDPFVLLQSERMATRILNAKLSNLEEQIQMAYRISFSRSASKEEVQTSQTFLQQLAVTHKVSDNEVLNSAAVWKDYCHSLFNLKEFIFLI